MRPCKTTHLTSTNGQIKKPFLLKKNRFLGLPHGTPAGTLLSLGGNNPTLPGFQLFNPNPQGRRLKVETVEDGRPWRVVIPLIFPNVL